MKKAVAKKPVKKTSSAQTIDLFYFLKQILSEKKENLFETLSDTERNKWSTYMVNRFLSMSMDRCELVSYFSKYAHNLDNKLVYEFYKNVIPKSNPFTKYLSEKSETILTDDETEKIKRYYGCSERELPNYLMHLSEEDIKQIVSLYGEIKKK